MNNYKLFLATFLSFAFLIIAPLVVLYAAGYQITRPEDQIHPEFQVTGGLRVNPSRSYTSYLNQQPLKKTPFFTTGLTPGTVTLTLRKSGYQSWTKNLAIEAHRVTMVNAPILFPRDPSVTPLDSVNRNVDQTFSVPDTDIILYSDKKPERAGLWLFFPEEKEHKQIFSLPKEQIPSGQYQDLIWSQNRQKLLFTFSDQEQERQYLLSQVLTEDQPKVINLTTTLPLNITSFAIIGNDLFYQQNDTIFKQDLSSLLSRNTSLLSQPLSIAKDVDKALIKNNRIFYHSQANIGLYEYRFSSQERERLFSSSPIDFLSLSPDNQFLFFTNKSGNFVFNLQEETLKRLPIKDITQIDYSSHRALIQTSSQIVVFYLHDIESYITRSQGSVESLYSHQGLKDFRIMNGSSEYGLFISDGMLKALEFDPRGTIQSFPLIKTSSFHQYYDGENLIIYVHKDRSLQEFSFPIREGGVFD